ncbi:Duf868 family protein [Thalictrum thalictroides]|uniref:Duf868 family protein n=1 Tax=Thalictrum thalictroides TaxID=46969 RepID=A0A7J6W5G8_THATH|nr:Duf868 family protein [Thalictrum thalictroides]
MTDYSSSFSSCFRPTPSSSPTNKTTTTSTPKSNLSEVAQAPPISGNPNLTTCLYHTDLGLTALTWCKNIFGRALHIDLHFDQDELNVSSSSSSSSFHLHLKPFLFWRKHGVKRFDSKNTQRVIEIYWDLTKAKFFSSPEPQSCFYVAVVVDGEMILIVGDLKKEAYERTNAIKLEKTQSLVLRREHVFGNKLYTTKARFGGKIRDISIDCSISDEPKLCFSVDNEIVLQIKRLKWKFRGNEKIEVDGVSIQVSWDVFNWLFEDSDDGHAVFMFRFEQMGFETELNQKQNGEMVCWQQQPQGYSGYLGMNGFEKKKLKRSSFKTRSSSSSSISSGSSGSSSSIMEWASKEENELHSQSGFSLLVYAWKN